MRVLAEHSLLLERLPEAVREKIGSKATARNSGTCPAVTTSNTHSKVGGSEKPIRRLDGRASIDETERAA